MSSQKVFVGVDVGTGSARAGVFDASGNLLATAKRNITMWHEAGDVVEQSSDQIWQTVCESVREAVASSGVSITSIAGIGFDATCSLVVVRKDGSPVTVSPSGVPERNIIVWMDHRSATEAEEINAGKHDVLRYVGGRISPEMETPKLLWLKRHLPKSFADADYFFDLPDYLTWRASGALDRSICTVTCKWTYLAHEKRWDEKYFKDVGLAELADEGFARIGTSIVEPGTALGKGLTAQAAADLGLLEGTAVGASLIDAHAGGVGTLGGKVADQDIPIENRLAYIFGTSACAMASTQKPVFVNGVWGPYFSAMIPGLWLNEGGQSAAGAAIDHLVEMHPAAVEAKIRAEAAGLSLVGWLDQQVQSKCKILSHSIDFARDIHVIPEFLGNRSPFAEPDARAIVAGLGLEVDFESLISLYVAGLSGIGYGLKQLLNRFAAQGIAIKLIVGSGGAAQSKLVCQILADATETTVSLSNASEPVLLGTAMLAAVAHGQCKNINQAMLVMSGASQIFEPSDADAQMKHQRRFKAFEVLQASGRVVRNLK